jgi:ArsR family transcriptional regulator, arsenate/arsenite/antimonite-responsive transcriptional repressor
MTRVMKNKNSEDAKIFKAFCDENRLSILSQLGKGERCACTLLKELSISQSTISHHMKILCESGIVKGREEGKWTHYSLSVEGCEYAKKLLSEITTPETVAACEEDCSCK